MKSRWVSLAALIATALLLPAVASAGEWAVDPPGVSFTSTSGTTILKTNNNETVTCTGSTGQGEYEAGSQTTGTIELTFTGCKESIFGTSCSSAGQVAGTITTTLGLVFTNTYLTDDKKTPGVTIKGTGSEEHFVGFSCGGGSVKIKVTGTVLGKLESACGAKSKEHKVEFHAKVHGGQEFTQVTATGAVEDLTSEVNILGAINNRTSSQDGTGTLKFAEEATVTCV